MNTLSGFKSTYQNVSFFLILNNFNNIHTWHDMGVPWFQYSMFSSNAITGHIFPPSKFRYLTTPLNIWLNLSDKTKSAIKKRISVESRVEGHLKARSCCLPRRTTSCTVYRRTVTPGDQLQGATSCNVLQKDCHPGWSTTGHNLLQRSTEGLSPRAINYRAQPPATFYRRLSLNRLHLVEAIGICVTMMACTHESL